MPNETQHDHCAYSAWFEAAEEGSIGGRSPKAPQKGPGAETPGLFLRKIRLGNRTGYSRLFSSALLNRWMTSPRKVTLIFAP